MTVAETITSYSATEIKARLLGYLQGTDAGGVTDWYAGGVLRTLMERFGIGLADLLGPGGTRALIVAEGFPGEGSDPDSIELLADQLFDLQRNFSGGVRFAGTTTQQTLTLTCDVSNGPYTVTAGAFWVRSPITGNRYVALTGGTIPNNGTLVITVKSEHPQDSQGGLNYSDGAGTLTILETPLRGVTASNNAPDFSGVTSTPSPASGLGVVTVTGSVSALTTAYDVQIMVSGQVGTATFQYRSNGGAWSATQTTAANFSIPSGPTLHFTNDAGGSTPSFVTGDRYGFTSPGTPITQQGVDPETDGALLQRCAARWPDLFSLPVYSDKREGWARAASAVVTRVRVAADPTYPGRALVTIAGAVNPVSGGVVTGVQRYIDEHEAIGDLSLVAAATVTAIAAGGTVFVPYGQKAIVQAAAAALWVPYVNGTNIGGVIRLAKLEQFLMDSGAKDVSGLTLDDGSGPVAGGIILATNAVGQAGDITTSLAWQEVAA